MFTVIHLPGKPERGTYRIDLATIPARYEATQQAATADIEQVSLITADRTSFILIRHGNTGGDSTMLQPCSTDSVTTVFGAAPTAPLTAAGTIAGMPAQSTRTTNQIGDYRVTCATDLNTAGFGRIIIIAETVQAGLSADANAILAGLRFSTGPVSKPVTDG